MTVEEIRTEVAKAQPDLEAYDLEVLSTDKDMTYLTVVCLKKDTTALEDALRAIGFARPSQVSGKVPSQWKSELEAEIEKLKADSVEAEEKIKAYEGSREELKAEEQEQWEQMPLEAHMEHYESQGMDHKSAMKRVAKDRGVSKRDIFRMLLELGQSD